MSGVLNIPTLMPSHAAASSKIIAAKVAGGVGGKAGGGKAARPAAKKISDEVYKATRATHRFDSFAPERSGNAAKW